MSDIRVSEKHGLNPSMIVCILCHESTAIALVGKLPEDKEAPRKMLDPHKPYEPCEKCREKYLSQGTLLLSATENRGKPEYAGDLLVIKDTAFSSVFGQQPPPGKICFVPKVEFDKLYRDYQAAQNASQT